MTRQTDAPTASVFDANSYALQHAARTMPDGSRSIRLLKIIPGTSVTHGARSTCWSPPKARSHSGNQPATRVSYPTAAGRSNDKNPSAWSNASSHGDTTFIAGSWPGYSAQCSRPEEVSGLLADVGQRRRERVGPRSLREARMRASVQWRRRPETVMSRFVAEATAFRTHDWA